MGMTDTEPYAVLENRYASELRFCRRRMIPMQMIQKLNFGRQNRILGALSPHDLALIGPHLVPVELKMRQRLQDPNRSIANVYFPHSGIVSVIATSPKGRRQAEIAIVGSEGMTGLPVLMNADRSPYDVFMQSQGTGESIPAGILQTLIAKSPSLLSRLLRYAYVFDIQAGCTALANAHGSLQERLARWLGASPPLNLWVRTAPRGADHYCWRIDILPRLTHLAGLELGTGVHLNVVAPEQAAAELRDA